MNTDQEFKQNKCSFESQTIKSWLLCSGLSQSYFLASIFNLYRGPERILWNEFTGPLMLEWVHNTPKYLLPCTIFIQHPLERRREALSGGWMPKRIELRGWVFPPVFSNSKKKKCSVHRSLRLLSRCRPQRHNQSQRSPKKFWYRCMHLKTGGLPRTLLALFFCTVFKQYLAHSLSMITSLYVRAVVKGGQGRAPNIQIYKKACQCACFSVAPEALSVTSRALKRCWVITISPSTVQNWDQLSCWKERMRMVSPWWEVLHLPSRTFNEFSPIRPP